MPMSPQQAMQQYAGSGMKTGAGQPIPFNPQTGAPDINAIIGQMVDRGKWYYYDTLKLAPATAMVNQYNFFATSLGQADPYNNNQSKTKIETNLATANKFDPPYDLILNNLGFYFASYNKLYDIQLVTTFSRFEFKILDKIFFEGHLWRHPPGAGVFGSSSQVSESTWGLGVPQPQSIYSFGNWAKYIAPIQRFTLQLFTDETIGQAVNSVGTASLTPTIFSNAGATLANQPTLLTQAQGGNGIWLVAFMNGLTDRAVQ
jgi:hypothetical protein